MSIQLWVERGSSTGGCSAVLERGDCQKLWWKKRKNRDQKKCIFLHPTLVPSCFRERQRLLGKKNRKCRLQNPAFFYIPHCCLSFWGEMELILEKIENKDVKPHVFLHSALLPCCFRERRRLCHENEKYGRPKKNTFFCIPSCCHPVLG